MGIHGNVLLTYSARFNPPLGGDGGDDDWGGGEYNPLASFLYNLKKMTDIDEKLMVPFSTSI